MIQSMRSINCFQTLTRSFLAFFCTFLNALDFFGKLKAPNFQTDTITLDGPIFQHTPRKIIYEIAQLIIGGKCMLVNSYNAIISYKNWAHTDIQFAFFLRQFVAIRRGVIRRIVRGVIRRIIVVRALFIRFVARYDIKPNCQRKYHQKDGGFALCHSFLHFQYFLKN